MSGTNRISGHVDGAGAGGNSPDDPRLTAYALGELPESERGAVESLLRTDAAARSFVDDVRAMSRALGGAFAVSSAAADPVNRLEDAQRAAIREAAVRTAPAAAGHVASGGRGQVLRVLRWAVPASVAAATLVAVLFRTNMAERAATVETAQGPAPGWRYPQNATRTADLPTSGPAPAPVLSETATPEKPTETVYDTFVRTESPTGGADPRVGAPSGKDGASETKLRQAAERDAIARVATRVLGSGGRASKAEGVPQDGAKGEIEISRLVVGKNGDVAKARSDDLSSMAQWGTDKRAAATVMGGSAVVLDGLQTLGYIGGVDAVEDEGRALVAFQRALPANGFMIGAERASANYAAWADNPFAKVADAPLSTFGLDVDSASWSNVRRFLRSGKLPPPGAVRLEEFVNAFRYRYAAPTDGAPFAVHVDVAGCPWNAERRLVRIGVKAREVESAERPASNLVFLLDVSGSMQPANRLPLVIQAMKLLVPQLREQDKVSIVVYAGAAGLVLPPTSGAQKDTIIAALDRLQSGGSTAGAAGIELAYKTADAAFIPGGVNRVVLATDGDFNVGISDESSLVRLIEEKKKSKVFLSVLGVGDDNYQDAKMERLANRGDGNYAYLDDLREAQRVLVEQSSGTLMTVAKDAKVQVEFNPLRVASYRLLGYENRALAAQDFADDTKDAGEVGAGHTVTALYEIEPTGMTTTAGSSALRYQQVGAAPTEAALSGELLTVKMRWKPADGDVSVYRERPVTDAGLGYAQADADFKFAAAVASFGMILRGSPHKGTATLAAVEELAGESLADDPDGRRKEFLELVRAAKALVR